MSEITKQFVKVENLTKWNDTAKGNVETNGQIAFVNSGDTSVAHLFAQGETYGDGAVSEKVITTSEIMVDGGPLATAEIKEKFPNGIPAGTNLEALLMSLFCKVLYPVADRSNISGTASFSLPALTITTKNSANATINAGTYEVGTIIKTSDITDKNYTVSLPTRKVTGMKYGFSIGEGDDKVEYDATSYEKTWVDNTTGTVNYTKTATLTGWTSKPSSGGEFTAYSFVMAPGNNVIKVDNKATGSFNASVAVIPNLQMYTNAGTQPTKDEADKSGAVSGYSQNTSVTKSELTNSTSKTFVGAYPVLLNGTVYNDANGDGAEINGTATPTSNAYVKQGSVWTGSKTFYAKFAKQDEISWKIAIPNYYTGATITAYPFDGLVSKKYDIPGCTFTKTSDTVTVKSGNCGTDGKGVDYTCDIWECTGTSGANGVKLTIDLKVK